LAAKRLRRMAGLQAALDSGTGLAHPIVVPDAPCPWKRLQGYHVSRGDPAETRGDTPEVRLELTMHCAPDLGRQDINHRSQRSPGC
jgi:hypothetical protein